MPPVELTLTDFTMLTCIGCLLVSLGSVAPDQFTEATYINNYKGCKESQARQEEYNADITNKCTGIVGLNAEICGEIYNLTVANQTKVYNYCERACVNIASPTTYEKSLNTCVDLFRSYNIVWCISEDKFNSCVADFYNCREKMVFDYSIFAVSLSVGFAVMIFMIGNMVINRVGI